MTFGDQMHACKNDFSKDLVQKLREEANSPNAFDPADMVGIFQVHYLMLVFAALNKADLIRGCVKVAEAQEWLSQFKQSFTAWEAEPDYPALLKGFEDFVEVCEDNN